MLDFDVGKSQIRQGKVLGEKDSQALRDSGKLFARHSPRMASRTPIVQHSRPSPHRQAPYQNILCVD